jgi:hypothetical protein
MTKIIQSGSIRFIQDSTYTLRLTSIVSGSNTGIFTQVGDDIKFEIGEDTAGFAMGLDDLYAHVGTGKSGILFWDTYLEARDTPNIVIVFTPTSSPTSTLPNSTAAQLSVGVVGIPSGRIEDFDPTELNMPVQQCTLVFRHASADQFRYNTVTFNTSNLTGGSIMGGPLNNARFGFNIVDDDSDDRTGNCSIRGLRNNCLRGDPPVYTNKGTTTRSEMSRTSKIFIYMASCRGTTSSDTATVTGRYEVTISLPSPKTPIDTNFGMGIIPKQ